MPSAWASYRVDKLFARYSMVGTTRADGHLNPWLVVMLDYKFTKIFDDVGQVAGTKAEKHWIGQKISCITMDFE